LAEETAQSSPSRLSEDEESISILNEEKHAAACKILSSPLPPQDDKDFALPTKTRENNPEHSLEKLRFDYINSGEPDKSMEVANEWNKERQKVCRETVLEFFRGEVPNHDNPSELQALALYLLKNNMPDALAWLCYCGCSEELDLSGCSLGDVEMQTLAASLETLADGGDNSMRLKLVLGGNNIGDEGARVLAQALPRSPVTELDLYFNPIGDEGLHWLCASMRDMPQLKALEIGGVFITNQGIEVLCDVLENSFLEKLGMDDTRGHINDEGAERLAQAFAVNGYLQEIKLELRAPGDSALGKIARSWTDSSSLKALSIQVCSDDALEKAPKFFSELAGMLERNATIEKVRVSGISMSKEDTRKIVESICVNRSLTHAVFNDADSSEYNKSRKRIKEHLSAHRASRKQQQEELKVIRETFHTDLY
jgi:hypothetical protein